MNYQMNLLLMENKTDGASLLLYGFSVPTLKDAITWKKSDVKFKESHPIGNQSLKSYRLTSVLSEEDYVDLNKKFLEGFPRIKTDRSDDFSLFGEWCFRESVEVMDDELNPLPYKTSNLTGCGANTKKSFWSLSDDPLSDFLCHVAGDEDEKSLMYLSSSYGEILELASDEIGLNFKSDDFLNFGNLDLFENNFGSDLDVLGFKVSVSKASDPTTMEIELKGLTIELLDPLLKIDSLIFKIDLNGTSDRIFSMVKVWKQGDISSFQVQPNSDTFFSSYRVEVFNAATGAFLSKESNYLMTEIHMNMSIMNQSRTLSTEWSRRQLATRPSLESKTLEQTTLTSEGPGSVVGGSRKKEPWRRVSTKLKRIKNLYSKSEYDYLAPKIDNITDVDRVKPIMDLVSKGRYEVIDIFDPYFDPYSIEKVLLRISSQSLQVNIYSYDDPEKSHFADLINALTKVREWIPCSVRVFAITGGFHDRFFVGHDASKADIFAVTNSLDGYSKSYPMWIVPIRGYSGISAHSYVNGLKLLAVKKWDLEEENKRERESFSKSLSSEENKEKLKGYAEFQLAESNGLTGSDHKILKQKYGDYLTLLDNQMPTFSFEVLAHFAYWGFVSEYEFFDAIENKLDKNQFNEIERLKSSIRNLVSDVGSDVHYQALKQLLGGYIRSRDSIDLSKSIRDVESLFGHPLQFFKMPNRHRIILWSWLIKHNFETAYNLYLETTDVAFIMSLIDRQIYRGDVAKDIVRSASKYREDRLLFTFALIVLTKFSPAGGVPQKEKALDLVEEWTNTFGSDLWDTLLTFAYIISFGKRGNEETDIQALLDKISALWEKSPLDQRHFESVNVLIRGGIIHMKDKQVFLFAKKLECVDEAWSQLLYEKILERLEGLLKKEGGSFHFFHAEDNGLLEASRHILSSWSNEDRNAWFANALPNRVRYLPNRPFMAKKNFDAYSGAINQMSLWAIMKLSFSQHPRDFAEVLEDIDQYLLPGAYQHNDFFEILKTLFQNIYKLKPRLGIDQVALVSKWEEEVSKRDCNWWPSAEKGDNLE